MTNWGLTELPVHFPASDFLVPTGLVWGRLGVGIVKVGIVWAWGWCS